MMSLRSRTPRWTKVNRGEVCKTLSPSFHPSASGRPSCYALSVCFPRRPACYAWSSSFIVSGKPLPVSTFVLLALSPFPSMLDWNSMLDCLHVYPLMQAELLNLMHALWGG